MKIDLRAEYTDTKSVCVYTEQKNGSNYIYIIVSVKNLYMFIPKQKMTVTIYNIVTIKNERARILRAGVDYLEKKAAANLNFLDNLRAMWFNIAEIVYTTDFKKSCKLSLIFERLKSSETVDT